MANCDQQPDFRKLAKRLTAYGAVVFAEFALGGEDAVIPGGGQSIEDFVAKILLEYTTGKIKHHASRGALMTVLGKALRNDVIDALRKKSHEREESRSTVSVAEGTDPDEERVPALDGNGGRYPNPVDLLDEQEYSERVRSSVEDEPELKEVVEAVLDLQLYKPQEIADAVATTASDIQNRKKKLRRRLAEKGLLQSSKQKVEKA